MNKVLTIAGSDCSGGAGIQADLKTITAHGLYGMSAITALTAQNTMGVYDIMEVEANFLASQLDAVFTDIRPDAVKIGMVSSADLIQTISRKLKEYKVENILVDPVMVSTSGSKLLSDDAMEALKCLILPLGRVITPNIPEAEVLTGFQIKNEKDMIRAGKTLSDDFKVAVLVKGGHLVNDAVDLLYHDQEYEWFRSKRIANDNTHGTGCTLSSAIACGLAEKKDLARAIGDAKKYLTGALEVGMDIGHGSGPLPHGYVFHH